MKNSHYTLDDGGGGSRGLENNTEIFSIIVMKQIINFLQIKKKIWRKIMQIANKYLKGNKL